MTPLQSQIDAIPWFHHYDSETFGFETKGIKGVPNRKEIERWGFTREVFEDKTVLDIGAWDGYYSFYAEKMGASSVLATDHFCWSGQGWGTKAGFDLVHQTLQSKVESMDVDLPSITPESIGTFDVVLFLGVLYHLPDPIQGLIQASSVAKELLIVETTFETCYSRKPFWAFRPKRLEDDPTNFWSPSIKGLEHALINICKFRQVDIRPWSKGRLICYARK